MKDPQNTTKREAQMNKQLICEIFDELEQQNPSKSTEWLLCMTADKYNIRCFALIDNSDVAGALCDRNEEKEKQTDD